MLVCWGCWHTGRILQATLGQGRSPHLGAACMVGLPWYIRFSQTYNLQWSGLDSRTLSKAKHYESKLLTSPWDKQEEPKLQVVVTGMTAHNISDEDTFHWYIPVFSYWYISIHQHMHFSPPQHCRVFYNKVLLYIMLCWIIFRSVFLDLIAVYNMWNLTMLAVSPPSTTENIATLVQKNHSSATAVLC